MLHQSDKVRIFRWFFRSCALLYSDQDSRCYPPLDVSLEKRLNEVLVHGRKAARNL